MTSAPQGTFIHYRGPGGAPEGYDREVAALRQDTAYHMDTKGWRFLAYSWAVGQSGRIYEARGWDMAGGHTYGWNNKSHAVLWIGGDQGVPSDAALKSIKVVVDEARRRYGYDQFARPHNSVNSTSCPGGHLTNQIALGYFEGSTPETPSEETPEMAEPKIMLRSSNGKVWLTQGVTKVHVPTPDHVAALRYLGVVDAIGKGDADTLLECLGTLEGGL